MEAKIEIKTIASQNELDNRGNLVKLYLENPLPENEKVSQAALFLKRQ